MKKLIANWKLNKTEREVKSWFDTYYSNKNIGESVEVIVAPSSIHLAHAARHASIGTIKIAAQDMSVFTQGPHTGEVGGFQIQEYAKFVIIGHSERRAMGEDFNIINEKISISQQYDLIPIICFSSIPEYIKAEKAVDKQKAFYFAYEPVTSIGTRNPASLQSIHEICKEIGLMKVIYGGSVDFDSIVEYLSSPLIDGFLVGGASLDPVSFYNIAKVISTYLP